MCAFLVIVGNCGYDLISCDINVGLDRIGQRSCYDWSDIKVSTLRNKPTFNTMCVALTVSFYLCVFVSLFFDVFCLFVWSKSPRGIFAHSKCKRSWKSNRTTTMRTIINVGFRAEKKRTLRLCHFFSDWAFVRVDQSIRVVFFDRASQMVLLRNPQKWQLRPWRSRLALKSKVDTHGYPR